MNAIINNNQTYKVTSERGDFWITEDIKGKVKMFAKKDVEVVEVSEMAKAKTFKKSTTVAKVMTIEQRIQEMKIRLLEVVSENPSKTILTIVECELNAITGNEFIDSLKNQWFNVLVSGRGSFSEKQAYFLAKFLIETK